MLGTILQSDATASTNFGNLSAVVGGSAAVPSGYTDEGAGKSSQAASYGLVALLALYLIWAVAITHQRLQEQVRPSNVAVNFHNIIVVGLTAMLFILIGKLATIKLVAWNVPGVAWLAQLFAAA